MKIESLKVGTIAYTITKTKAGNTNLKTTIVHSVVVTEIHEKYVMASWNGNKPKKFYESSISKWKKNEPVLVSNGFGTYRLATKEEKKTLLENKSDQ